MLSKFVDRYLQLFQRSLANVDALPQLAVLGTLAGIATGIVVLGFRAAIEIPLAYMLPAADPENFEDLAWLVRALLPLGGAMVVGLILHRLKASERRFGINHVIERLNFHQGHISLSSAMNQFLLGVLTLFSGQSAGREGPAVHLGAASSSLLGQWMRLPNNSIRILVACGTAAAISASFNTPIAGVIFAMEVVLMEYTLSGFTPVILAAVSAAVVNQLVYGDMPAFTIPPLAMNSLLELPFIILMGLVFALCSASFVRIMTYAMGFSERPVMLRIMIAGLITAAVGLFLPHIMGIGYDTVSASIAGELGLTLLILIGAAKLVVTACSIGLGMPSGIIGPTLFVGATLGAAIGIIGKMLVPDSASSTGFYALLGMGAMMGAVLQAPLSAMMAVIELTRSTQVILPAMLVIVTASLVSATFFKQRSVFLTALERQGLDYQSTPLSQALRRVGVGAMMERDFIRTQPQLSRANALALLQQAPRWLIVETAKGPLFAMAASDLARHLEQPHAADPDPAAPDLAETDDVDLCEIPAQRRDLAPLDLQATLEEALQELDRTGVEALYVHRTTAPLIKPIVGIISRSDIENYYQMKNNNPLKTASQR